MKSILSRIIASVLVLSLAFCLVSCKDEKKKVEKMEPFEKLYYRLEKDGGSFVHKNDDGDTYFYQALLIDRDDETITFLYTMADKEDITDPDDATLYTSVTFEADSGYVDYEYRYNIGDNTAKCKQELDKSLFTQSNSRLSEKVEIDCDDFFAEPSVRDSLKVATTNLLVSTELLLSQSEYGVTLNDLGFDKY